MKSNSKSLVWLRRDLRIYDNEALFRASEESDSLICVYIHCPEEDKPWERGAASKWWLHHSLHSLKKDLHSLGSELILTNGESSLSEILKMIFDHSIGRVYWNRIYDPHLVERDIKIKNKLHSNGIEVISCKGNLLKEPWEIKNGSGKPYQVFTPFWRNLSKEINNQVPFPRPKSLNTIKVNSSLSLEDLNLLPNIPWDKGFYDTWVVSEDEAQKLLNNFLLETAETYKEKRDFPSLSATSKLSPYLHFGQISSRTIWYESQKYFESDKLNSIEPFLRQIGWRDFAHHLLFNFPHTDTKPLKKEFEKFPWKKSKAIFSKWQKGKTGIPIVDAGMRELWHTGIMHNRVRMITASLLVKNLLIPWQDGSRWFWDTLIDADLPNNTLGWQWVAGSGADAAPYFRIFNPVSQGERFDKDGSYVRKWVPELKNLPSTWIHKPWECPDSVLSEAGIVLGKSYPKPLISLKESREEALSLYQELKSSS